jgi:hypothetical protein
MTVCRCISVKSNNYEPTLFAFDIVAFSKDSANTVMMTKFTDDESISGLSAEMRETYKVKGWMILVVLSIR